MEFTTKFKAGQRAYLAVNRSEQKFIECDGCAGTGTILLLNGETARCPKCAGQGGQNEWLPTKWVPEVVNLGSVRIDHHTPFDSRTYETVITYVSGRTGTGNVYKEEHLFATQEEAQVECDRRNAESNETKQDF